MSRYLFGDCELEVSTRSLEREQTSVAVEPKVFDLLVYLIEHRSRVLSHEELLDAVWPGVAVAPAAIARAIKEARRSVGDDGRRQSIIATVHGRGYRFVAQVSEASQPRTTIAAPLSALDSPVPSGESTRPGAGSTAGAAWGNCESPGIVWLFPRHVRPEPWPQRAALLYGRSTECAVTLLCKDASRRHAQVFRDGPIYVLRDLDSMNGTFVNGERVRQAPLRVGDVVRMGDSVGCVVPTFEGQAYTPSELAPGLIGSAALARALSPLRTAGRETRPVVLVGEAGTGKDLATRALAYWSPRSGPWLALECSSLSREEVTARLSGGPGRPGLLAAAEGGTLVLDHITDLACDVQAMLHSTLARGQPDARTSSPRSNARIVVTSRQPLEQAVAQGRLLPELHARFEGVLVQIPPLRDRIEDVPALFAHFVRVACGGSTMTLSAGLIEHLCLYAWPGNVRELEATVRDLLLKYGHEHALRSSHLPAATRRRREHPQGPAESGDRSEA